jgi:dolichol-phosphate mannosyltransferase
LARTAFAPLVIQPIPPPGGPLRVPEWLDPRYALRLSVIVPTFNESKNIVEIISRLSEHLDPLLADSYELVVVDDDSPDKTWEIATTLCLRFPQLRVVRRTHEKGLASAVVRGWQVARGEVLAVIDADMQHPPEVIVELWNQMERGADVAVASRHVAGGGVSDWSLPRRMLSRGAQLLGLMILPEVLGKVSDPMSGYFMVRRDAIAGTALNPLGYKILIEVLGRGRGRWISEVGYVFQERHNGESKVTTRVYLEYLAHLARLRCARLWASRFVRFGLVGASGVLVDMGALFVLSDPVMLGWNLVLSKAMAAELAIVNNFLWNDAWTFRDLASHQRGAARKSKRLGKFNVICGIGLLLNVAILYALFAGFGMNRYAANAVAIGAVALWNFWLNLKLNWSVTDVEPRPAARKPPVRYW